jgi:hypothetical protein
MGGAQNCTNESRIRLFVRMNLCRANGKLEEKNAAWLEVEPRCATLFYPVYFALRSFDSMALRSASVMFGAAFLSIALKRLMPSSSLG